VSYGVTSGLKIVVNAGAQSKNISNTGSKRVNWVAILGLCSAGLLKQVSDFE